MATLITYYTLPNRIALRLSPPRLRGIKKIWLVQRLSDWTESFLSHRGIKYIIKIKLIDSVGQLFYFVLLNVRRMSEEFFSQQKSKVNIKTYR